MSDDLSLLESIRARPGMYLGGTDEVGLAHMLFWAFDDILDNARAGRGNAVRVDFHRGDETRPSVLVYDEGPTGIDPATGPALEVERRLEEMTRAIPESAPPERGLISDVQVRSYLPLLRALSARLEIFAAVDGSLYRGTFEQGGNFRWAHEPTDAAIRPWRFLTRFWPDPEIFGDVEVGAGIVRRRLQEMCACRPGFKAVLHPGPYEEKEEISMPDGMGGILPVIAEDEGDAGPRPRGNPFRLQVSLPSRSLSFDVAIEWHWGRPGAGDRGSVRSWANTVRTREGSHVLALKEALRTAGLDDVPYAAAISVSLPQPRFAAPTKDRLVAPEVRQFVRDHLEVALRRQLDDDVWAMDLDYTRTRRAEMAREEVPG